MKTKYVSIGMALSAIFITSAFAQDYVKPFPSKEYNEYRSWRESPLNPLVNSKPDWTVNKWPPPKHETTIQEQRVWTVPATQKSVSSENKEKPNSQMYVKPHIETIR